MKKRLEAGGLGLGAGEHAVGPFSALRPLCPFCPSDFKRPQDPATARAQQRGSTKRLENPVPTTIMVNPNRMGAFAAKWPSRCQAP